MRQFSFLLSLLFASASFAHEDWSIQSFSAEKTLDASFVSHEKEEMPYLALNLNYEMIRAYFEKVDQYSYRPLKSRGEAHITVVTPIEFKDDLSKFISIAEINQIAEKLNIQKSSYKPFCIGRGFIDQNAQYLETYFIVVESENLLKIRKEIAELYRSRGGNKFDPTHFYPHITLGFTDRDLHESDGVIKDAKLCMKTLHFSPLPSHVKGVTVANSFYVDKNKSGGAIIRGNAPLNHRNLKALKDFGVSKVIVFKNDKAGEVKSELGGLRELGFGEDSVTHINFDWKDNQDFSSGCKKFVQGIDLMNKAMKENKKLFFHCTTGEDRTGALTGNYLLSKNKNADIKKIFRNEMCAKGYEGGDPDKDKEVVERIRTGLTQTFLKTAFRIQEAKRKNLPVDDKICEVDPSGLGAFKKYQSQMNFVCETPSVKGK